MSVSSGRVRVIDWVKYLIARHPLDSETLLEGRDKDEVFSALQGQGILVAPNKVL